MKNDEYDFTVCPLHATQIFLFHALGMVNE